MPRDEETTEKHESFGLVGFSRVSGGSGQLFGSSIRHHHFIRLRIATAQRRRSLNTYWYGSDKEIVEVDLSPTQFSDLLVNMNIGDGVPCTLRYVMGKQMEPCPTYEQRKQFVDEFKGDIQDVMEGSNKLIEEVQAILDAKKSPTKGDLQKLKDLLFRLRMDINDKMPFVHKQFNEAMDKTTTECKGEAEAFVSHLVTSLGIEALRGKLEQAGGPDLIDAVPAPAQLENGFTNYPDDANVRDQRKE